MATNQQITGLGGLLSGVVGNSIGSTDNSFEPPQLGLPPSFGGGGGGGGGSAQDGLGQVNTGASTIASAIGQAQNALGGSGGGGGQFAQAFKKGGTAKKYTTSGGRLNLSAGGASTAQKNKKQSNW